MPLTLKFIGAVRQISGKSHLAINFSGFDTLRDLIGMLSKDMPDLEKIFNTEKSSNSDSNSLILVNGKEISVLNGLNTKLRDGDEVVFIPVVHGG